MSDIQTVVVVTTVMSAVLLVVLVAELAIYLGRS